MEFPDNFNVPKKGTFGCFPEYCDTCAMNRTGDPCPEKPPCETPEVTDPKDEAAE
jgi:hypothetical protein